MNCRNCNHQRNVPGSAHSSCVHPIVEIPEMAAQLMIQNCSGRMYKNPTHVTINDEPAQDFAEQGLRNGWVLFPFNFDPTWLNKCLLYESI